MDFHNSHVMIDGQFVSAKVERIVLAIKDYEPTLQVKWVPPSEREEGQSAFAIIHDAPGNAPYVMFYVKSEDEFDERVLQRIIYNDQRTTTHTYSELEAWERAQALVQKQEHLDQMEEAQDIAYHVFKSPLNTYKVNNDLVVKEGIPFNAARRHRS